MLLAECVDFSANFLCSFDNVNFQIPPLVLNQYCYLNYVFKALLCAQRSNCSMCIFSWLWAEILKFYSGLMVKELIPYGLTAKSWLRAEHLLAQICSSTQVVYSFLFKRGLLWNKPRLLSNYMWALDMMVFTWFWISACYFLTNFSFLRRNDKVCLMHAFGFESVLLLVF